MNLSKKTLLIFATVASVFFSCKKDKQNPEHKEADEVKSAATHNNEILPGAGNFFVPKSLLPDQATQLIAKLAYNSDSVFYFGSTNSEAKITRVHTIMVSRGAGKYFVTEYGEDNGSTISYHILNGVKDNLVAKTTLFSADLKEMSLLNYDWTNNSAEVITAITYKNNLPFKTSVVNGSAGSAKISAAKISAANTWTKDCGTPAPENSSDLDRYLYNSMQFISCNGTHPINEPWLALDEKLKNSPDLDEIQEQFNDLKNSEGSFTSIFDKLKSAINKLMPTASTFDQMEWLQKLLKKFADDNQSKGLLRLSEADSDLEYNEGGDKLVRVILSLTDPETGLPYKKSGQLVTLRLKKENTIVYDALEYTSKIDGTATFLVDIDDIPDLGTTAELRGEYGFKDQSGKGTFKVSLKWIVPNISIYSGQNQNGEYGQKIKNPLVIKIVDNDGNPVNKWPVIWSVKTGNGFITSDSETNASGLAQATWTFGNDLEQQAIEVTAKDRSGNNANGSPKVFNASVVDSLELYERAVVGKWTVSLYDVNNPTSTYNMEMFADGRGRYSVPDKTTGEMKYYGMTWSIEKGINGGYFLYETGFWHPVFNYTPREPLSYPVSGFKTFENDVISQLYVKN